MEIRKIRELAKQFVLVNKYSPLILYALVMNVVVVFALLATQLNWFAFAFLPIIILYAPVAYSSADFYMRSYNLKTEESFRLFEGFKREHIMRTFILYLIRMGFGLLFSVGFFVGFGVSLGYAFPIWAAVGIGLLFSIPFLPFALYYFARTSLAFFLLRSDVQMTGFAAFKLSISATSGRAFDIMRLFLSYLGWFCLAPVSVGFSFVYAMPHYQTAKSIYFRREILELRDDEVMPASVEERLKVLEIRQLDHELQQEKEVRSVDKKRKKFDRQVIPDEMDFEQQAADIRKMITAPEVILPPNARNMNPADLEIRENETFDEYRARVQRYRNLNEGRPPIPSPQKRRSNEEEAARISAEKERLAREAELEQERAEAQRQAQLAESYFKTDEDVAKIVEEQIEQNTADMNSYPGKTDTDEDATQTPTEPLPASPPAQAVPVAQAPPAVNTAAQSVAAQPTGNTLGGEAVDFVERKKAVAEKLAMLKADHKSSERVIAASTQTRDRRQENDRRAHTLLSREPVSSERALTPPPAVERPSAVVSQERQGVVENSTILKPSREEILERIRRERDKK